MTNTNTQDRSRFFMRHRLEVHREDGSVYTTDVASDDKRLHWKVRRQRQFRRAEALTVLEQKRDIGYVMVQSAEWIDHERGYEIDPTKSIFYVPEYSKSRMWFEKWKQVGARTAANSLDHAQCRFKQRTQLGSQIKQIEAQLEELAKRRKELYRTNREAGGNGGNYDWEHNFRNLL